MKYSESLALGFIFASITAFIIIILVAFVGILMDMKPVGWIFLGLFLLASVVIGTVLYLIDKHKK